ncbi:MAG: transglycosylase SLT domain-containing protein [Syntrophobacteraceae bacterium]|nr:transglycosylase SLT domain-containing protein [Syntrophobacteraceae bacterium]
MPTIPANFTQSVMPRGGLAPQQIQANPADFGARVGQTLEQSGNELMHQAVAQQQFQNETAVNDVINNKFFPAFQDQYQKYYALQGKDAVDQLGDYQQSMRDLASQYRAGFSSPMQQRLFDQQVTRRIQYEIGGMGRYADQQNKVWQAQTSEASVQRAIGSAADKYNDPNMLYDGVLSTAKEIAKYGAMAGQGEDVVQQRQQAAWDKLYSTVIERQAIDASMGPQAANTTFQDGVSKGFISGGAQLNIARYLRPMLQVAEAQRAYGEATGHGLASQIVSEANNAGLDPTTALTIATIESGLNPAAKNPDSSAQGLFQHLDSTWQGLGGTPENRSDPNAQIAIGIKGLKADQDQLAAALNREPQPWELYLAHQQGVAGAEKLLQADQSSRAADIASDKAVTGNGGTEKTTVGQFLSMTKDLFARKSTHFTDQGLPTPQHISENYDAGLEAVTGLAERDHPGDPAAVEQYRNVYIQQAGQTIRAREIGDQANRQSLRSGFAGPSGAKSWQQFLSDPGRAQSYANAHETDPQIYNTVNKAITANALGAWDPPASQKTNDLRDELKGMQATDATRFSGLDLNTVYGDMPMRDWTDLLQTQTAIRNHDDLAAARNGELVHALEVAKPYLLEAAQAPDSPYHGADPDPESSEATAVYNLYAGRFGRALDDWRQNNGGKVPSDADLRQIARGFLFSEDARKPMVEARAVPAPQGGGSSDS